MRTALLALFIAPFAAHATDLLVAVGGSGNVYPTISGAHAAAVEGDRILVEPGTYTENVTITKSVEIVSNSPAQRFTLNGDIIFSPANAARKMTVMYATVDSIRSGTATGTGHEFTLIGCRINTYINTLSYNKSRLLRDSIMGRAEMRATAEVIGCVIQGTSGFNGRALDIPFSALSGLPPWPTNLIIGNLIGAGLTSYSSSVVIIDAQRPFRIENNYLMLNGPNGTNSGILVTSLSTIPTTTTASTILNNTVRWAGSSSIAAIKVAETDPDLLLDVRNNFIVGACSLEATGTTATADYNIASTNLSDVMMDSGMTAPGSPAINAGDPEMVFTDLDLTRNDAGCYGGSLSRDNFDDPLPATAVVVMVNAPRRTQTALAIPITADGFDH